MNRVRWPIAFKLVAIIAVVLILSLAAITVMVSVLIGADVRVQAEDNNLSVNAHLADALDLLPAGDSAGAEAILGAAQNQSFVAASDGTTVFASDEIDTAHFKPFARGVFDEADESGQRLWTALDGKRWFVAFHKLKAPGRAVITVISRDEVFAGVNAVTVRNVLASLAALAFSVILVMLYSRTISVPLGALIDAAQKIEDGDYEINLRPRSRDEIGALTESFNTMGFGLTNFEKFTNKMIVEQARKGILTLAGETKKVTVCFAFIRDYSVITANLDAAEVVAFTNFFLSIVDPCVIGNGGSIDKFLTQDGMVIMALWGAVESAGGEEEDAEGSVRAALAMRAAVKNLNDSGETERLLKSGAKIKLGCGINSGEVVVGQMGSEQRMEFTVIGDAVNLAARFEGPNDLFDTDILISESTRDLTCGVVSCVEMPSLEVKGKEEPLRVFAVTGLIEDEDAPRTIEEVRALW